MRACYQLLGYLASVASFHVCLSCETLASSVHSGSINGIGFELYWSLHRVAMVHFLPLFFLFSIRYCRTCIHVFQYAGRKNVLIRAWVNPIVAHSYCVICASVESLNHTRSCIHWKKKFGLDVTSGEDMKHANRGRNLCADHISCSGVQEWSCSKLSVIVTTYTPLELVCHFLCKLHLYLCQCM